MAAEIGAMCKPGLAHLGVKKNQTHNWQKLEVPTGCRRCPDADSIDKASERAGSSRGVWILGRIKGVVALAACPVLGDCFS